MEKEKQWFSIGEAAEYLGISKDTLRRWEKKGKIQTLRSPTNRRFYTSEFLDNVMAKDEKKQTTVRKPGEFKIKLSVPNWLKLAILSGFGFLAAVMVALFIQKIFLR